MDLNVNRVGYFPQPSQRRVKVSSDLVPFLKALPKYILSETTGVPRGWNRLTQHRIHSMP